MPENFELGTLYKVAIHNIKGIKKLGKRELIETWANQNDIDILLLQETYVNQTARETRKDYTYFFSGQTETQQKQRQQQGQHKQFIEKTHGGRSCHYDPQ